MSNVDLLFAASPRGEKENIMQIATFLAKFAALSVAFLVCVALLGIALESNSSRHTERDTCLKHTESAYEARRC